MIKLRLVLTGSVLKKIKIMSFVFVCFLKTVYANDQ